MPRLLPSDRSEAVQRVRVRCPRCRLGISPRAHWLTVEHCPRCLARRRIAIPMVTVPPGEELT
jgi:phage FluMu protein Com